MKSLAIASVAIVALAGADSAAVADDTATVDTLLAQGYTVVAAITSQIGPGVFLQKGAESRAMLRVRDAELASRDDALLQAGLLNEVAPPSAMRCPRKCFSSRSVIDGPAGDAVLAAPAG